MHKGEQTLGSNDTHTKKKNPFKKKVTVQSQRYGVSQWKTIFPTSSMDQTAFTQSTKKKQNLTYLEYHLVSSQETSMQYYTFLVACSLMRLVAVMIVYKWSISLWDLDNRLSNRALPELFTFMIGSERSKWLRRIGYSRWWIWERTTWNWGRFGGLSRPSSATNNSNFTPYSSNGRWRSGIRRWHMNRICWGGINSYCRVVWVLSSSTNMSIFWFLCLCRWNTILAASPIFLHCFFTTAGT